jgi:hypothetical protein
VRKFQKRSIALIVLAVIAVAFGLTGCGNTDKTTPGESTPEQIAVSSGEEHSAAFSFADVSNLQFWFGSGAGGWCTVLNIAEDGSFSGEYMDSELGAQTTYLCDFTGQFSQPIQVNDDTYSVQLESISYERESGTEERAVVEGYDWTYSYTEPYGLDDATELLIYLPGTPVADLPEGYQRWMSGYGDEIGSELPFYGLYNVNGEQGLSSYVIEPGD